jgi:hypothetical protein
MPQADVERILHLFVLGLLASLSERYTIKSNLESWGGRYDIAMHPKRAGDSAVVIECKKGKEEDLESLAKEALHQIEKKDYLGLIHDFGYTGPLFCYGIAVHKKQVIVKIKQVFL